MDGVIRIEPTPVPSIAELDLQEKTNDFSGDAGNAASVENVPANKARTALWIVNDSDTTIYLGLGRAAVLNRGIRLNLGGGAMEINKTNLSRGTINSICGAANKNMTITELESRYAY